MSAATQLRHASETFPAFADLAQEPLGFLITDHDKRAMRPVPPFEGPKSAKRAINRTSLSGALSLWDRYPSEIYAIARYICEDEQLVCIDLDSCIDGDKVNSIAAMVIEHFASYTERSPSGKGVHILVHGSVPSSRKHTFKGQRIELISCNSYFTLTGDMIGDFDTIEHRSEQLRELWEMMPLKYDEILPGANGGTENFYVSVTKEAFPKKILDAMLKQYPKFNELWYTPLNLEPQCRDGPFDLSAHDLALASCAAHCGVEPELIGRLIVLNRAIREPRQSHPRNHDKAFKHKTYIRDTVRKALWRKQNGDGE